LNETFLLSCFVLLLLLPLPRSYNKRRHSTRKAPVEGATVILQPLNIKTGSLTNGSSVYAYKSGTYQVVVTYVGAKPYQQELTIADKDLSVSIN
jgi:hypothetical protein